MPLPVVNGAQLTCSFGLSPAAMTVLPTTRTTVGGQPVATIKDMLPIVNIGTFGMCNSLANPSVAAATAAALGVLTPMPCVPAVVAPWQGAPPTKTAGSMPILVNTCTATCAWGGMIQVVSPGQFTVQEG